MMDNSIHLSIIVMQCVKIFSHTIISNPSIKIIVFYLNLSFNYEPSSVSITYLTNINAKSSVTK